MQQTCGPEDVDGAPPFSLGRPIQLGLPFTIYELRLTHRLLENLQAVSRFLLRAAALSTPIEAIVEATALSTDTIKVQFDYLRHQGFVGEDLQLTELGRQLVDMECHLPIFVSRIGIDNFCARNVFVLPPEAAAEPPPPVAADVQMPDSRTINYFVQIQALGQILLSENSVGLLKFLKFFWPEHEELLEGQLRYLDYKLIRLPGHPAGEITISVGDEQLVPVETLRNDQAGAILPVLAIERSYSGVAAYPWHVALPPTDSVWVELFSNTVLPANLPCVAHTDDLRRVLPAMNGNTPPLPAAAVPMGISINYRVEELYACFRIQGSLMTPLRARYNYLILGESHAA